MIVRHALYLYPIDHIYRMDAFDCHLCTLDMSFLSDSFMILFKYYSKNGLKKKEKRNK